MNKWSCWSVVGKWRAGTLAIAAATTVVALASAVQIRGQQKPQFEEGSLFVSNSFDPEIMRQARPLEAVYQNVLSPWITAQASGTLRAMQLDIDITLLPGRLYEATVSLSGDSYTLRILNSPGTYTAGKVIRTNAVKSLPLAATQVMIEDGILDEAGFRDWLVHRRDSQTSDETPLVALGWERSWQDRLLDPSHPGHWQAVAQGALALDIAHEVWPQAMFSFYGFPWGTTEFTQDWEDEMVWALGPIIDRVDWLAPNIYDKLKNDEANKNTMDRQRQYHLSVMRLACRVADGRPIVPWIRHRYYHTGFPYHNRLIEKEEFLHHVQWAWDFSRNGEQVDGFVLWYRDREDWEQSHQAPPEATGGVLPEDVLDEIEERVAGWIHYVMRQP